MATRGYFNIDNPNRKDDSGTELRRKKFAPVSALLAVILFITIRIIYGVRVCQVLAVGDSGHLATAAYTGGIAHPTGYPLFTIIGNIFTHLWYRSPSTEFDRGIFDVAFAMNMMSMWFGVITVLVVYFIIARVVKNPFAAFLGAFLFGVSSTFLSQCLIGEVYTLNALIVALIIYVAVLLNEKLTPWRLTTLALLFGLGFAHHSSIMALVIPVLFFLVITFIAKKVSLRRSMIWGMVIFFIIGWLVNLYLPIASAKDPYLDWGNPENPVNFIKALTRSDYRQIKASFNTDNLENIGYGKLSLAYRGWLNKAYGGLFIFLGYAGLVYALFKGRRFGLLLALAYIFTTIPYFIYFSNITQDNLFYLEVYYIPAHLMFAIFLGYFFVFTFEILLRFLRKSGVRTILSFALFMVLFIFAISTYRTHGAKITMKNHTLGAHYTYDILNNLPTDAILITFNDHIIPFIYFQQVAEIRRDVVVLDYDSIALTSQWLWYSTSRMHPTLVIPEHSSDSVPDDRNVFIDKIMLANRTRPVYFQAIDTEYVPTVQNAGFHPAGFLWRYAIKSEYDTTRADDDALLRQMENMEATFTTDNLDPYESDLLNFYVYAYYNYGMNYMNMSGMEDKGFRMLLKSFDLKPDGPGPGVPPTAGVLAESYLKRNDWLGIHNVLKDLLDRREKVDSVYYYMDAAALVRLKRFTEARAVVDKALKLDSKNQFLVYLNQFLSQPDEELINLVDMNSFPGIVPTQIPADADNNGN
jgi:hypothetical protein